MSKMTVPLDIEDNKEGYLLKKPLMDDLDKAENELRDGQIATCPCCDRSVRVQPSEGE